MSDRKPLVSTLRALEQAADAAPWIYSKKRRCVDTAQVCDDGTRCDLDEIPLSGMDDRPGAADANGSLIAALRNAAPALFAAADFASELAGEACEYGDNCPTFGTRHGKCLSCKARAALAALEESA